MKASKKESSLEFIIRTQLVLSIKQMGTLFFPIFVGMILLVTGLKPQQRSVEINPNFFGERLEFIPKNGGTVDQSVTLCFRAIFKTISKPRAPGNKVQDSRAFR